MTDGTTSTISGIEGVVDEIARDFAAGGGETLRTLFLGFGAPEPRIVWSPDDLYFDDPILRRAGVVLRAMAGPDGRLMADAVNLQALDELRDWLVVLTVEPGGVYRYRHYGRLILEHHGVDMTGRTTAEIEEPIGHYLTAFYRAVEQRGEWALSEARPPRDSTFVTNWIRLMVPLHSEDGKVAAFVTISVPVSPLRAGLELMVDPVLVVDEALVVRFANTAARRMFSLPFPAVPPVSLETATGLRIDVPFSAEEMLARQEVIDRLELLPRDGVIERFAVTVSAASQRDSAFYVVVLRLIGT